MGARGALQPPRADHVRQRGAVHRLEVSSAPSADSCVEDLRHIGRRSSTQNYADVTGSQVGRWVSNAVMASAWRR